MPRPLAVLISLAVAAGLSTWSDHSRAQATAGDTGSSAVSESAADSPNVEPGEARAAFDEAFKRWKYLLKDLRDLQQRFSIAEEDEVDQIRQAYLDKVEQGEAMVDELRRKGIQAYLEAPTADSELTRLLLTMATDDLNRDRYDEVWEVSEALMSDQVVYNPLYDLAGTAAFATQRFGPAVEYLNKAQEIGVLDKGTDLLEDAPKMEPLWQEELRIRAEEEAADDLPRVRIQTSKGDIIVELFENEAPDTVGNFIYLVEKGFYDGLAFHRVLPGFVAQAGCPRGDGTGDPGYRIYCECYRDDHRNHFRGSLSMAKGLARDTGGSQFFITFRPTPHLDGKHTVFGRVLEGWDVLEQLQRRDPSDPEQSGIAPDRIIRAQVMRKWDHVYEPNRVVEP